MSTPQSRTAVTTRIAAAFAAVATTSLLLGSQLGLSGHYTAEADAVLAAKRAAPLALNTTSPATPAAGQGS